MSHLPPSWTNTVSLFNPQESLTLPVNRRPPLVRLLCPPFCLQGTHTHANLHTNTHTHTHSSSSGTQRHKQVPVKYLTTPLSSYCLCHHLCLLVCLLACSLGSSVFSAIFPIYSFLPFICSVIYSHLSSAPGQSTPRAALLDNLTFFFF